jgi:hypothetical protein
MKCKFCGCTYERACPVGCSWVGNEDICSVCWDFAVQLADYAERCNKVSGASLKRLLDDAPRIQAIHSGKPLGPLRSSLL